MNRSIRTHRALRGCTCHWRQLKEAIKINLPCFEHFLIKHCRSQTSRDCSCLLCCWKIFHIIFMYALFFYFTDIVDNPISELILKEQFFRVRRLLVECLQVKIGNIHAAILTHLIISLIYRFVEPVLLTKYPLIF